MIEFDLELDEFSGPFDVLIELIYKKKLAIDEVSLLKVTDEFIAYVRKIEERFFLPQASEFLVVASTLLQMKANQLLESDDAIDLDDLEFIEAKNLLFAKLIQYKAFKDIADDINSRLQGKNNILRAKIEVIEPERRFQIPAGFSKQMMLEMYAKVLLDNLDYSAAFATIRASNVSIKEVALKIVREIMAKPKVNFAELIGDAKSQIEIVAFFLACLELYRMNAVDLKQTAHSAISLSRAGVIDEAVIAKNFDEYLKEDLYE